MKKRVFIVENTNLGGRLALSVFLTSLLSHYSKNRLYEWNAVVAGLDSGYSVPAALSKVHVTHTRLYSIKDNFLFAWRAFLILRRENMIKRIDLLHCLYPNSSLGAGVLFKIFVNRKVKIIYDVRSPWIEMSFAKGHLSGIAKATKPFIYFTEFLLCKWVDHFVFISEGLRDFYLKKLSLPNVSIAIIPTGVDTRRFSPRKCRLRKELNLREGDVLIGQIGGMDTMRKLDDFLHMFRIAADRNPRLYLLFIGDGAAVERLKNLVSQCRLKNHVFFVSSVPHDEIVNYIAGFDYGLCHLPDIFVFRYSVPLKVLEYLSVGIPVLASDLLAHRELKKQFAKEITIYDGADTLASLKRRRPVRNDYIEQYSWSSLYGQFLDVYEANI